MEVMRLRADALRRIEELVREFLLVIGENPDREGLRDTPARVARMWVEELSAGYRENPDQFIKVFREGSAGSDGLVVVKNVPVRSICEHHLLPFFGYAHIAYVPNGVVLGFSKFARVIDVFAKRLQIQERLTREVTDYLYSRLRPKGILVLIEAVHTCALVRGVEEPMHLTTMEVRGVLKDDSDLRLQALSIIKGFKVGGEGVRVINGY